MWQSYSMHFLNTRSFKPNGRQFSVAGVFCKQKMEKDLYRHQAFRLRSQYAEQYDVGGLWYQTGHQ